MFFEPFGDNISPAKESEPNITCLSIIGVHSNILHPFQAILHYGNSFLKLSLG